MTAASALLHTFIRRLRADDRGASLVEYALLVALIALACFGALAFFGNGSANSVDSSRECIEAAYDGGTLPDHCD